ncbi:protein rep [uncultured Aquimarina sp.]|uniref:protein rep n=1 Tax=uncultured Aquimarina sp. TaxID=575652 RepID=UPI00261EE4F2|nr:protein rep [uncultured Aquimarina sp.]
MRNIYTLAQDGTAYNTDITKSVVIKGVGTDLKNNPSLLKRANKKVITNALVMALVDVAKECDDKDWIKKYWNTYHCQNKFISYKDKVYTDLCKNRWCSTCNGIRKAELLNKYYSELIKWEEPHLLTLTLRTVKANQLAPRIDEMVRAFTRIKDRCNKRNRRGKGMKIKGIKSLECNFNATSRWYNPHYHIITPNRQTALYIKQEWKKEWNKNGEYNAAEKGQDVSKIRNVEKGLIEVIKYGAKMLSDPDPNKKRRRTRGDLNGLSIYAKGLHVIYKAFEHRQLFKSFGFKLKDMEIENSTTAQSVGDYELWKYRIDKMDWVNESTGEYLTDYELDVKLEYLLQNSIDTSLY